MKASIKKTFFVEKPIGVVWANLSNPNEIVTCVPGASITEQIDEKNFKGIVSMKFGPVKAEYNGEITIDKLDSVNYEMVMKGKGLDSKGKGSADMVMVGKLKAKDGGTDVEYNMDVTVIGMLAQFGSRLITDVSGQLADQFIENFKNKLAGEEGAPPPEKSLNAVSMMVTIVKNQIAMLINQIASFFTGKKENGEKQPENEKKEKAEN